jgi:hypothetical protein
MSRKVFTAGEVLAAADVNNFLMDQSVMSFAGTAARGSAIGTAVEGMVTYLEDINSLSVYNGTAYTTDRTIQVFAGTAARGSAIPAPVEGMYAHLNDTDALTYYNGSAWANAGASSGLTLLNTTTFSAVPSQSIDGVFNSTYDNYKISLDFTASADADLTYRLRASGVDTTTNYARQLLTGYGTTTQAAGDGNNFIGGVGSGQGNSNEITLFNPNRARYTIGLSVAGSDYGSFLTFSNTNAIQRSTTQFDGIKFGPSTGTFTGTITIYGMAK